MLEKTSQKEIMEYFDPVGVRSHFTTFASAGHGTLKGLDPDIDPDRAPKSFMSRKELQEWEEALNKEYRDFKDRNTLAIVKPPKGARILGTLAWWEYKEDNCTGFSRRNISRENFPWNIFPRGNVNGAHRFPALVTEMAALMAAPVLHEVRWRCLTPRGIPKPARSTCRFQPLRRNKPGTDTAGHTPACSTCMP